jgi:hypothetical protein
MVSKRTYVSFATIRLFGIGTMSPAIDLVSFVSNLGADASDGSAIQQSGEPHLLERPAPCYWSSATDRRSDLQRLPESWPLP